MTADVAPTRDRSAPTITFAEQFTPKLFTVLREGYGAKEFRADAFAGATVAIVALPLSMAIAIASGVGPERGLYAAIIGGFLVSLLGGSRFQIGGPAGAFIILVAATVERHGLDGMLLATLLSGLMLMLAGFLRLGAYIRLIPYPVTVGFTAGIAVIIFASQIRDLLGLTIAGETGHGLAGTLETAAGGVGTTNPYAVAISLGTVALIVLLRRWRPSLPGILIAVTLAGAAAALFGLPVETIGTRFGGIPSGLPAPALPAFSLEKLAAVFPDAFSFTLLGAIESLLSATVADGMTGRRHRSNSELVAQGAANVGAAFFGAMVVTGTIARTATNIRAGAHGPVSGMLHSLFLLLFMLVAAPLAAYAPLAALAGVLAVVAWNMIEREAIASLVKTSKGDAAALAATFFLTVFRDLTEAIVAGVAIGALAFISRMAGTAALKSGDGLVVPDRPDGAPSSRPAYDPDRVPEGVAVYRVSGALFFGSAASLAIALDKILAGQRALVLDFSEAAFVDSTGAQAIRAFAEKARRQGVAVVVAGAGAETCRALSAAGLSAKSARYAPSLSAALEDFSAAPAESALI
ncbi:MAG: SulP family inorganic anion transporter [Pseudomonadota bacterium]|nr:SulP family inorganic anion transporter [Pseudomonadota bacterium]